MILQVNKKKKEVGRIEEIDFFFKKELEGIIKQEKQTTYSSKNFARKSGKTTLITELAKKYKLPIVVSTTTEKQYIRNESNPINSIVDDTYKISVYAMDRDFDKFHGSNITLVLVDNITERDVLGLNKAGISVIGFVNDNNNFKNEIFEDYIEVSSVRKFEGCIVAQINQTQIHLFFDKEFKRDYDSYSEDNLDFLIDSAYLLDDTGKTIRKLM